MIKHSVLSLASAVALSGCMTIDSVPTAELSQLFDAGCLESATYSKEVVQAAKVELARRGHNCRDLAMFRLQTAQPMRPIYVQPSFTPTPTGSQPQAQQSRGLLYTLSGYRSGTSASGQSAYICEYVSGYQTVTTVRLVSSGPCPPTAYFE